MWNGFLHFVTFIYFRFLALDVLRLLQLATFTSFAIRIMDVISLISKFFFVGFQMWILWNSLYHISPTFKRPLHLQRQFRVIWHSRRSISSTERWWLMQWLRYSFFSYAVLGCIWNLYVSNGKRMAWITLNIDFGVEREENNI